MTQAAQVLAQAERSYSGVVTRPARWSVWQPRVGDVLVCTPAKCGTTWTQSILSMLVHGGPDLPGPVPVISPWVDADLGVSAEDVAAALAAQTGRRVVKTHAPADGYPVWDGVQVVAVYRHPLDVFLSLRSHLENRNGTVAEQEMLDSLDAAFDYYLSTPAEIDACDRDTLTNLVDHYQRTALSGRLPGLAVFHYADMMRDGRAAVARMARVIGVQADDALLDSVTRATGFDAMRANAQDYAPVAGTGFWKSDAGFFASGGTEKWRAVLSPAQVARFEDRLAELLPDAQARHWLLHGNG